MNRDEIKDEIKAALDRIAANVNEAYQHCKTRYPDVDRLLKAAQQVDPDLGFLDLWVYLDDRTPTHFSSVVEAELQKIDQERFERMGARRR